MLDSKLYILLQSFKAPEWRTFVEFVSSPFFNKKLLLTKLLLYLRAHIWLKKDSKRLKKEIVYRHLYPNEPFNEKKFNYLKSELFKLAEKYLAVQSFLYDNDQQDLALLKNSMSENREVLYSGALKRLQNRLSKSPSVSYDLYAKTFELADIEDQKFQQSAIRKYDENLAKASFNLDAYYLTIKLRHYCVMLNNEMLLAVSYPKDWMSEITDLLAGSDYLKEPPILLYYELLMALKNTDGYDYWYDRLKADFLEYSHHLSPDEQRGYLTMAINFCGAKIWKGEERYVEQMLNLYQYGLEKGILLTNGQMSPWTYKNMVRLGINLRLFDWLEAFIFDYKDLLPEEQRDDAFHFSLSDMYYSQGELDKAQEQLNAIEFSDVSYYIGAKILLMKIYFEKKEEEALFSLIFSFKLYLKRNKLLTQNAKRPYENFVKFLHLITKSQHKSMLSLKDQIESTEVCTEKRWLMAQLG